MGEVTVLQGCSLEMLKLWPSNSVDSCVTDPPYALVSIVKRFGGANAAPTRDGDVYSRASAGFMGQTWDTGEVAFAVEFWAEVLRVLKPGGHVLAFSGSRTYHRLAVAIEDAGFEIRDQIMWLYGSGFPKNLDVSKQIDKAAGAERERGALKGKSKVGGGNVCTTGMTGGEYFESIPATDAARQWQGWGTALKPAHEPIVMARKPLVGTVAANVLAHGTGAINVEGCRVAAEAGGTDLGRWPANVIHDGSDEVVAGFPVTTSGSRQAEVRKSLGSARTFISTSAGDGGPAIVGSTGSAARFFYCAKASKADRGEGNTHPTVKPTDLMAHLCRLVTPPGGLVLDPFAGSGSTGLAARAEGFNALLIEREAEYVDIIHRRLTAASD